MVLSIVFLLLSLPVLQLPNLSQTNLESELLAQQIKDDFLYAQQIAMSYGRQIYIKVDNPKSKYILRFTAFDPYFERSYPKETLIFQSGTLSLNSIAFLPNGHPIHSGTFFVQTETERYQFIIYLGKGMISYKKI